MARTWSIWLSVWCWGVLAFGALLMTAAAPGMDGLARRLFVLFADNPDNAAMFGHPAVRFGLGLQGALTIGWGMTMLAAFQAAKASGPWLWRALTWAVVTWWFLDSAISVMTGFWINAVSNTVLLIAFVIPIAASGVLTRGSVKQSAQP
jgi:hypothetical protein